MIHEAYKKGAELEHTILLQQLNQSILTTNSLLKRPNTVIPLGDSISELISSSASSSVAWYYSDKGYLNWANVLMGQRFKIIRNAGIGGQKIYQIVPRIDVDVIPYHPGWCSLLMGANDWKDTFAPTDATVAIAFALQAIQKLTDAGIGVIIGTVTPINAATAAGKKQMDIYNHWLRTVAAFMPNVIVIDFRRAVINGTTDVWATGTSDDGLHPNALGAYYMGKAWSDTMSTYIPPVYVSGNDVTNGALISSNPLMTGDTGGVATGWSWYASGATATLSKVSRASGGYYQQIAMTATSAGNPFLYQDTSLANSGCKVGDTIIARTESKVLDGYTASSGFYNVIVRCLNGSNGSLMASSALSPNSGTWSIVPSGTLQTIPIIIPEGTVNLRVCLEMKMVGTVQFSQAEMYKSY